MLYKFDILLIDYLCQFLDDNDMLNIYILIS